MVAILQAVFSGLALGGIYALVALGFSITHTTTKTFNFGQGEFLAVGTLVGVSAVLLLAGKDITEALQVSDVTPFRYAVGLIASVVVLGLLGVLLYYTAVRPFVGFVGLAWVMSTIGFGIIIQNTALAIWGPTAIVLPSPLGNDVIRIGGAGIVPQEVLVLIVTIRIFFCMDFLLAIIPLVKPARAREKIANAPPPMGVKFSPFVLFAFVSGSGFDIG